MERIAELLHLAYRQSWALEQGFAALRSVFTARSLKAACMAVLFFFQSIGFALFEVPLPARGQALDLGGYELVFCDDFDADALDEDAWRYRIEGARRDGIDSREQVAVRDGNLVITAGYREDGPYGAGWYTGNISLRQWYIRGYFEIRCKCVDSDDFWSAFWLQSAHSYDHDISAGGPGGAEIDIFEAMSAGKRLKLMRNAVTSTIHCNGSDDDPEKIDSRNLGTFRANDVYNEFNTYGLEWTEDEYIFYINGVETTRSSFGTGVSEVPEEVIISLESPEEIREDKGFATQYVIDYVKIWQKR